VPAKVPAAESASARLIDTGGGFLIEETVPVKQSSMTRKVIYDPGCTFAVCFTIFSSCLTAFPSGVTAGWEFWGIRFFAGHTSFLSQCINAALS